MLLGAYSELPPLRDFQARFICLVAGRLGLQVGEISHLTTTWFVRDRKLLQIPQHELWSCGCCRRQVIQEASHCDNLTEAEAVGARWHPKTVSSAQAIPFDLSLRLELCIERFANRYNSFPHSRSTINRRVKEAAECADSGR